MRRLVFLLALVLAVVLGSCEPPTGASERRGTSDQPFTSAEASLYDFELDGRLAAKASEAADPKPLVIAQLTYAIGQLNGDRSVGRYERLELSAITVTTKGGDDVEVTYHAKLPVAWGGAQPPNGYTFVLPRRVAAADQLAFEKKYGTSCVDTSVGVVDVGSMFLLYRPRRSGCSLDAKDVVSFDATTAPSVEGTIGKYPEYDRLWNDGVLAVVIIVSRDVDGATLDDGIRTHDAIVRSVQTYLTSRQPDGSLRTDPPATSAAGTPVKLGASLADGRRIGIDVLLVPHRLESAGSDVDAWLDAVTPAADLVLYNGHAGLGTNVRTLSQKGSFRPAQYVLWAVNGCDTFAYLDRTLADRRALLNPDDPTGTRYMDQVSNVMPGHFRTAPSFAMAFLDAAVSAADPSATPRTYREVFASVDPGQVVVVTGEEDNAFDPATHRVWAPPPGAPGAASPSSPEATGTSAAPSETPPSPTPAAATPPSPASGCAMGGLPDDDATGTSGALAIAVALVLLGLRARERNAASSSRARRSAVDTPSPDRSRPAGARPSAAA